MKIRVQFYCTVFYFAIYLLTSCELRAQNNSSGNVTCDFTLPDTVCRNTSFSITDLSQGATTYFWKYCAGTPLSFPSGIASGSLSSQLFNPRGITLVQDGGIYYAFITNADTHTILRLQFVNGLLNPPVYNILQNTGILTTDIFGIQVKQQNGNWYGFVTNGNSLARFDFGPSLANLSPTVVTNVSSPVMNIAQGLVIDYDGQNWVGFCTNYPAATITRIDWGNTLSSTPGVMNLGNIGGLTMPMQPALINDGTGWYMFIANTTSLSQLNFGNSLLNTPSGTNLGNMTWITDNRGVSVFIECSNPYALLTNHDVVTNQIMQIHFEGGLNGTKTVTPLGNVGDLNEIVALSETVNIGDTLFTIAVNSTPSTTVLYFPPCLNSVIPTSTQFNPSPVVFPDIGTYTVKLTIDAGLPTEQTMCKEITVLEASVSLGNDTTTCQGKNIALNAGSGFQTYSWSTGESTQALTVTTTGTYSVTVTNTWGCEMADSIHVTFNPNSTSTVDTTICYGESYFAGGKFQSSPGTYTDTLSSSNGCYQIRTTHLSVYPSFSVYIGRDTCITDSTQLHLIAQVPGATAWTWQDGSHDSILTVSLPGVYWVRVNVYHCSKSDTILVSPCPAPIYFYLPTAFTPNGDGLNDVFRPVGNEIIDFHMIIYNRWGQLIFESQDWQTGWDGTFKGSYCEAGSYAYILSYRNPGSQDKTITTKGTITLIR